MKFNLQFFAETLEDELWTIKKSTLKEIADAVRFRKNSTENIKVSDLATEILSITPSDTRTDVEYNKPIANDELWQIKKSTLKGIANAIKERFGILDEFIKVSSFAKIIDRTTIMGEEHEEVGGVAKIYGVRWVNDASRTMERTDDAVGLSYTVDSATSSVNSDFSNVFPWTETSIVTDSEGNKFLRFPNMWFRITFDTERSKQMIGVAVSNVPGEDTDSEKWVECKTFDYGIYTGAVINNKLVSKSGVNTTNAYTRAQIRAKANRTLDGYTYYQKDLKHFNVLRMLIWIETAHKTGIGIYGLSYVATFILKTGYTDNYLYDICSKECLKWHGIELNIGNTPEFVDGIYTHATGRVAQVLDSANPNNYNDSLTGYTRDGAQTGTPPIYYTISSTIAFATSGSNPLLFFKGKSISDQRNVGFEGPVGSSNDSTRFIGSCISYTSGMSYAGLDDTYYARLIREPSSNFS